jgi:acetylornithine deacetylase
VIDDIAELVAIPSISSTDESLDMSNRPVAERLGEMLESAGFAVDCLPVAGTEDKFNLIATLGDGPGGLVLSGHTDTVPFEEHAWASDPFKLTERDGLLFGLGSTDMKAFFALALAAAAEYTAKDLNKRLIIVATADEESGMSGARSLVAGNGKLADFALIGEPTNLKPVRVHKGILMERVTLLGRSGHSSDPALGISALDGIRAVLNELSAMREELQHEHRDETFDVPVPTMNFGRISGGDNPNRICAECSLDLDCRFLPGMKLHELRERIHERCKTAIATSGLDIRFYPIFDGIDAMSTPNDSEIVKSVERSTGCEAGAVGFATEAPLFAEMGTEVVVIGPGSIEQAHQPNEFIELASLEPTLKFLNQMIGKYCVGSEQ